MATSGDVLDRLTAELQTAQERTASREEALAALIARTRAQADKWGIEWGKVEELLLARRQALEAKSAAPASLVRAAEGNLEETVESLRAVLEAASRLERVIAS